MIAMVSPLTQTCNICNVENLIEQVNAVPQSNPLGLKFPACPACGSQEFFFVLTRDQNPGEHASLVREMAAQLGLISRDDPAYFPQP
jgi:hypothetical protein